MDFGLIPEGTSQALTDLINNAQNAECPGDTSEICCATKFILDEDPKAVNNVSALEELLFTAVDSANEEVKNLDDKNSVEPEPSQNEPLMNPLNSPAENSAVSLKLSLFVITLLMFNILMSS